MQTIFVGLTLLVSCKYEISAYMFKKNYSIKLSWFLSCRQLLSLDQGYRNKRKILFERKTEEKLVVTIYAVILYLNSLELFVLDSECNKLDDIFQCVCNFSKMNTGQFEHKNYSENGVLCVAAFRHHLKYVAQTKWLISHTDASVWAQALCKCQKLSIQFQNRFNIDLYTRSTSMATTTEV